MKRKLEDADYEKLINRKPYLSYNEDADTVSFCVGRTKKEAASVCKQILKLVQVKAN